MLTVSKDRPLLTTITGSLPRPHWFVANLEGRPFSLAMTDIAFREQYTDAVTAYLSDQVRAGLDLLCDGDARCDCDVGGRSWFAYATERLYGLEGHHVGRGRTASSRDKVAGDIMFEVLETRVLPNVRDGVRRGPLEYARVWKVAQRLTRKPVKFGAISGQMIATGVHDEHYGNRRDLIMALSEVMNEELVELANAGCPVIQVEEPAIHGMVGVDDKEVTGEFLVEAFNREVRGLRGKAEVWCHTCWGNPAAQRTETARRFYKHALPYFDELDVDVVTLETADNGGDEIESFAKGLGADKKIAIGVVSHRTLQVERPEAVASLIRRALQFMPPERLVVSTDCGFGRQGMSRLHAFYKMVALVRGTNIVRRELGLPAADILAADPKGSLIA
ncbi:MAG TPA: cobalamin-independent methionine synthase II family protein [Hyphomicrobiaceae bacterium]|jgi:methionine synthase II (cobalamin-independent)|nr:cobalamin-independent methionine synthase II family protein [Hyphomicrobiaceae bacterium]